MKRISLSVLIICLTSYIFAQQWHTTLDIRCAAKDVFPAQVSNLLIVNNAVVQPDDFGHALIMFSTSSNERIDLSQAPLLALFAAAEVFDHSELFSSVGVYEKSQANGPFFAANSLTRQQVTELCEAYNADAVLSLDRVLIYDKKEVYETTDMNFYAYLEVYATTNWTLTLNSGKYYSLNHSDTLVWDGISYNSTIALDELPDRQTALLDVARYAGEQFAKQFIPQWQTVDRYLYSNSDELINKGMEHFTYKRWQQAIEVWKQAWEVYNPATIKKSKKQDMAQLYENAAYAAANIAVAEEIQDNIKEAIKWAKLSAETFGKIDKTEALQQQVNMTYYQRQLEQRNSLGVWASRPQDD